MDDRSQSSIFRKESLERLSSPEQLDQLMQVVSPKSWIPLASLGGLVLITILWSIFGRIPITATGKGVLVRPTATATTLVELAHFDSRQADRIQPGMQVIIIPDTASSQRLGGLVGRVKQVAQPTLTTLDAARQAEASNSGQGDTVEVLVELEPDASTASGYKWSSMGGKQAKLLPGTPATARLTLEERAPIAFVFPFLQES